MPLFAHYSLLAAPVEVLGASVCPQAVGIYIEPISRFPTGIDGFFSGSEVFFPVKSHLYGFGVMKIPNEGVGADVVEVVEDHGFIS